jgi:hypothetical protein
MTAHNEALLGSQTIGTNPLLLFHLSPIIMRYSIQIELVQIAHKESRKYIPDWFTDNEGKSFFTLQFVSTFRNRHSGSLNIDITCISGMN